MTDAERLAAALRYARRRRREVAHLRRLLRAEHLRAESLAAAYGAAR